MPAETSTPALSSNARPAAPFLVWPVSQHAFYRAICLALIPALAWGLILFGFRVLAMLLLAIAASTFTYLLLKHWLKWRGAKPLIYMQCLMSAMVLVALSHPTWPIWVITTAALLIPAILAAIGDRSRERIHVAVALVLAVEYIVLPNLPANMYRGKPDAILARDRLFVGDIRSQASNRSAMATSIWPSSRDVGGNDAFAFTPPAKAAANTLNQFADLLPSLDVPPDRSTSPTATRAAGSTTAAGTTSAPPPAGTLPHTASPPLISPATNTTPETAPAATTRSARPGDIPPPLLPPAEIEILPRPVQANMSTLFDQAFIQHLPDTETFIWGLAPNRIGVASLIGLTLAGLYLSYRYILRPRSVLFFLCTFIFFTALFVFTPATFMRVGPLMIWEGFKHFPGQIVALFDFLLLNSDAAFAGVIILALPGTEPLTPRARRIFLTLAAAGAAALHRVDPVAPGATIALCLLTPVAPLFDKLFAQRSWLNRGQLNH